MSLNKAYGQLAGPMGTRLYTPLHTLSFLFPVSLSKGERYLNELQGLSP